MLENGVLFGTNEQGDFKYYNIAHRLNYQGENYIARFVVKEDRNGKRYYDHEFTEIEKVDELPTAQGQHENEGHLTHQPSAKLLKEILTAKNSSKVVDENGEPLIVYHGTDEDFTVFRTHSETGVHNRFDELPSEYFNFTDNKSAAGEYDEQMAVYLNVRDLLRADNRDVIANIIRSEMDYINESQPIEMLDESNVDAFIDNFVGEDGRLFSETRDESAAATLWPVIQNAIADYAVRNGYDGFVFNDSTRGEQHKTYAVFRPEQIKSATDNNGDFSPTNPDINLREAIEKGVLRVEEVTAPHAEERTVRSYVDGRELETRTEMVGGEYRIEGVPGTWARAR